MTLWNQVRLKNLCVDAGQYGLNISAENYAESGTRLLRTTDISSGVLTPEESGVFVSNPPEERFRLERGDLLLSRSGTPPGQSYLVRAVDEGATFAGYLVRFRPQQGVDPRFLAYIARSTPFQEKIRAESVASTIQNFNAERYANIDFRAPEYSEQRRIADYLDVETARLGQIESLAGKAGKLAVARRTAVIDAELGAFSDDYVAPVTSACELVLDCVNKTAPIEAGETPYRMLRTSNVRDGQVNVDDTYRVSEETFKKWNRRGAPRIGDVLFTRQAPVGEAGLLRSAAPVFLGQQVMLFRPDPLRTAPEFLLYNFLSSFMKQQFELASDGAAHSHMRVHDCLKLRIYYPPLDKQRQIVGRVSSALDHADRLRAATAKQADLLSERRQALITAAVTGQFDVTTASGRNVTDGVTA
ncbi:restriction endonuclease subunit S [Streptomyces sp. NRRL B-24085]|uniref:restriction endonuclease subunit S n=1 Tax=Streptomyces sp. NRRL B-24085 TaxID=1709476 RepID=UPI000AA17F7D|nr:restriction endonuclease subunit S [Streptomyces sp. NRRL B-24085]